MVAAPPRQPNDSNTAVRAPAWAAPTAAAVPAAPPPTTITSYLSALDGIGPPFGLSWPLCPLAHAPSPDTVPTRTFSSDPPRVGQARRRLFVVPIGYGHDDGRDHKEVPGVTVSASQP